MTACLLLGFNAERLVAQETKDALAAASALVRAGKYDAAIAEVEQGLRTRPADARLHTVEGIAYSMKGDNEKALVALRAALQLAPGFPGALRAEAQVLVRTRSSEAIPVLNQILRADPADTTAREMLAVSEAENDDCTSAVRDFGEIASALKAHPASQEQYGGCLFRLKRYKEAVPVFQQLQAERPHDGGIAYDLALAELRDGEGKAAAATLVPFLDETSDVDTLALASDAFEDVGDTPKAVAVMRRAIVSDPLHADSYVRFAELCMEHESYQAGVDMVSAGISRLPSDPSLYLARGMLYGGMAQYDKAEADFHAAESLDPKHGTGDYGVGLVQSQRNRSDDALNTTRTALRAHPEDAQLHFLLARILTDRGAQPDSPAFIEATQSATAAVRLKPDLIAARDLLAKIYMAEGKNKLAIEQCKAALALDPSDQNALYRLMRASREIGDEATAHDLAKQVADMHQRARQDESNRLRYRIEEAPGPGLKDNTQPAAPPHP